MLQRAANTIRDYRFDINLAAAPANDSSHADIATHLMAVAANVEDFPGGSVAAVMLDAADNIRTCMILMEEKLDILGQRDIEPEGSA